VTHLLVNKDTRIIENLIHIDEGNHFEMSGYEVVPHPKLISRDGRLHMHIPVEINLHKWIEGRVADLNGNDVNFDQEPIEEYNAVTSVLDSAPEVF
jgi:hypothetical protein